MLLNVAGCCWPSWLLAWRWRLGGPSSWRCTVYSWPAARHCTAVQLYQLYTALSLAAALLVRGPECRAVTWAKHRAEARHAMVATTSDQGWPVTARTIAPFTLTKAEWPRSPPSSRQWALWSVLGGPQPHRQQSKVPSAGIFTSLVVTRGAGAGQEPDSRSRRDEEARGQSSRGPGTMVGLLASTRTTSAPEDDTEWPKVGAYNVQCISPGLLQLSITNWAWRHGNN